ncbi:pilus assembly FimT family protein [Kaarinaea lacus]
MHKECSGFTLIELVIVIILASVLSAYAVVKWPSDAQIKLPAQAGLMVTHLHHIQSLAMHWGQPLRLSVSSGGYSVSCVTAGAAPCDSSPVIDPVTQSPFAVSLESGISLAGANIDFDSLGRPVSSGSLVSSSPARSFALTAGGVTQTVTVQPLTGFVSVSP